MAISQGKGRDNAVMIFDVGSGSIGAALVVLSRSSLPNILWSKRIPITFQENPDYDKLAKTMLSSLLDLALELQTESAPMLKKAGLSKSHMDVMFAFASPWYSMKAKVFKIEKEEPFALTEQFIKQLIAKEEQDFKQHANQKSETKAENISPVLIEREVIQTSLNGYIVSDPYGKAVKKSQVDIVLSAIPSYIYEKASDIRAQLLHRNDKGSFNSFILPAFVVTRDIFHNKSSFLLMDISAEVTDVVTVHKGTIVDATSFPIGKHFVIREVAKHLGTVPEEASSTLRNFMAGDANMQELERLNKVLEAASKTWLEHLDKTLERISCEAPIAKDLYITVDDDYGEWFSRVIASGDFSEYALSKNPFRIQMIGKETLEKHVEFNQLTAQLDPFLAIEALFMHKKLFQ